MLQFLEDIVAVYEIPGFFFHYFSDTIPLSSHLDCFLPKDWLSIFCSFVHVHVIFFFLKDFPFIPATEQFDHDASWCAFLHVSCAWSLWAAWIGGF